MLQPLSITPLPNYKIHLEFSDGVVGKVDLSPFVGKGVFEAWKDIAFFEAVTIGKHGEIRWNDEIELCSDSLYLEITGKLPEDVFPKLKASADA